MSPNLVMDGIAEVRGSNKGLRRAGRGVVVGVVAGLVVELDIELVEAGSCAMEST